MNHKIKILYVIDNLEFGGGERGISQLASHLDPKRYEIAIACQPGGMLGERLKDKKVTWVPLDLTRRWTITLIQALRNWIQEYQPKIVHSKGARADFFARLSCRQNPLTKVVSEMAMLVEGFDIPYPKKLLYILLDRYTERFVSHFIAVSEGVKQRLIEIHRIPSEKITVISHGIEPETYRFQEDVRKHMRQKLGIDGDRFVVGSIGRLVTQKGYPFFLQAAAKVKATFPDTLFLIVGDGPLRGSLEKTAIRLGLGATCRFLGHQEEIPALLGAMDIFVLSSVLEGFPWVVIEAMALERPIVATQIEGVQDQITHEKTGLLVPPGAPSALCEAILFLMQHPEEAKALGKAARKEVESQFSVTQKVFEVDRLYQRLLEGN